MAHSSERCRVELLQVFGVLIERSAQFHLEKVHKLGYPVLFNVGYALAVGNVQECVEHPRVDLVVVARKAARHRVALFGVVDVQILLEDNAVNTRQYTIEVHLNFMCCFNFISEMIWSLFFKAAVNAKNTSLNIYLAKQEQRPINNFLGFECFLVQLFFSLSITVNKPQSVLINLRPCLDSHMLKDLKEILDGSI